MDYDFRRDLYGRYQARFSMGHEALGQWLTEELGTDNNQIDSLLDKIEQLQNRQCWQHQLAGKAFTLSMNRDGIEVGANLLDDMTDEAPEELSFYDQESQTCCGLDDFRQLLMAWKSFVQNA